jgi:glycosyltransferase involved in cell wall biosynthesis
MKISAIITYYNEEEKIEKTLNFLKDLSDIFSEIIFINSSSTDNTKNMIDRFIKKESLFNTFKNISFNTEFPSDSCNLGLEITKYEYVFFLDCGLGFDRKFLLSQINLLQEKNVDAIFATTKMKGFDKLDVANVSQSYGYNKENIILPGSLIKKEVFKKTGKFHKSRSFYDVLWKKEVFLKVNYTVNDKFKINYNKRVYGSKFFDVVYKNYKYSEGEINIKKNKTSLFYLLSFIFFIFSLTVNIMFSFLIILMYVLLRQIIPFKKSGKNFNYLENTNIFYIFISGFLIDTGKLFGFFRSLISFANYKNLLSTIIFFIFISIYSPIYSILGNNLVVIDKQKKTDVAIVMSGNGEATYFNPDFQQRSIIAKNLYDKKMIDKLIIVSGKTQTIHEAELIKVILNGYGLPEKAIKVLTEYPNSTYDAVIKIKKSLENEDISEVIFVTSPFHTLRTKLIWNKNVPEIDIYFPETYEAMKKKKIKIFSPLKDIYVIIYEYLSIIYNYSIKRL